MKIARILRTLVCAAAFAGLARAADKDLNLFAWSEYIPQAVIDGFTEETGIKVNYETFASGEEMLAKLLAGGTEYDLIQPPDYIAEVLIKENLLLPLEAERLSNLKNILPEYLKMPHDPDDKFTIPYMTGTVGIVVNTERVKKPVLGIKDLFAVENKGRIVVVDDGRELVVAAMYTLGLPLNDVTPENIAKVRPILKEWMPRIKLYDSDSPKTALLNGDVDIGYVWSGEAALLWKEDRKFQYVLPEEGAHMFVDVLAMPKGAKNRIAAHKFLDYILRPEVSKLISEEFPYTNPNGEARKLLTKDELQNPASYPKLKRKLDTFRHIGESGALIDELITDLKNAR
jgi:spermidine/putrescine-binding protein